MKKSTWYVMQVRENGKFYASCFRVPNSHNLKDYAERALTLNACDTKKEAVRIVADWNAGFIRDGIAHEMLMP